MRCERPINYQVCSPPSPCDWQQQKRMSHYGTEVLQDHVVWKTTSHSNVCFWYGGSQAAVKPAKATTPSASLPLFCSSSRCHSSSGVALSWVSRPAGSATRPVCSAYKPRDTSTVRAKTSTHKSTTPAPPLAKCFKNQPLGKHRHSPLRILVLTEEIRRSAHWYSTIYIHFCVFHCCVNIIKKKNCALSISE